MNASTREQFEREIANRAKRMAKSKKEVQVKSFEIPLTKGYLLLTPVEAEPYLDTSIYWNVVGHNGFYFCP